MGRFGARYSKIRASDIFVVWRWRECVLGLWMWSRGLKWFVCLRDGLAVQSLVNGSSDEEIALFAWTVLGFPA